MRLLFLVALMSLPAADASSVIIPHSGLIQYAGRYPFEVVGGYTFAKQPQVANAIHQATSNEIVISQVTKSGVSGAIEFAEDIMLASSCQAHNCNGRSWAVAYSPSTKKAVICFFDSDLMARPKWFLLGRSIPAGDGEECATHISEVPKQLIAFLQKYDAQ